MTVRPVARSPALQRSDHCNRNPILFYSYKKGQSTEHPKQDFSLEIDLFMITQVKDNDTEMLAA
jgi:hypothetical protein